MNIQEKIEDLIYRTPSVFYNVYYNCFVIDFMLKNKTHIFIKWQPNKTLENQSEETINAIYEILYA